MTAHASETVTAIYELPVPVWVSCATLSGTYPTGCSKVRFDVVMPQERDPVGGPPVIDGIEVPESLDGELAEWTTEYAAWIPEEFQPATALRRIVITAVKAPTDAAESWRGPDRQLGDCIAFWFDQVRSWVEILTGQDLDPGHRVYDAEMVGAGLTFIAPPHEGELGLRLTTPHIRPVTAAEWRGILAAVREAKEPPLEHLLIRDANAAFARGFHRRAIIDAAAALEIALVWVINQKIEEVPEKQRGRLRNRPTLGVYISVAEISGFEFDVSFEKLKQLVDARNDAVHRVQAPDYVGTHNLLRIAREFLESPVRFKGTSAHTD